MIAKLNKSVALETEDKKKKAALEECRGRGPVLGVGGGEGQRG